MYGFMDREWLGESYDNYNGNADFCNARLRKTPRECVNGKPRGKNPSNPDGHEFAVRAAESATPKFDDGIRRIWECMSTDMMGNSQPTAGVFSGDNFAAGDLRQPVVLGGYSRFGKIRKPRRKNKSPVKEAVDNSGGFSVDDLFEYIQNYAFNRASTDKDGFPKYTKVMKEFVFHYPSFADAAMDAWRSDRQKVFGAIKKGIEDRLDSGCYGRSSHDDFDCDGNEDYWRIEDDLMYKRDRSWSEI